MIISLSHGRSIHLSCDTTGPYHRFVSDMYKTTSEELPPGTLFPTIIETISRKWKVLPQEGRKKYEDAFVIDREQRVAEELVGGGVIRT